MPNRYQLRKGRMLAALILAAACNTEQPTPLATLPALAAAMGDAEWRAVSFAANVPLADVHARIVAVAILKGLA